MKKTTLTNLAALALALATPCFAQTVPAVSNAAIEARFDKGELVIESKQAGPAKLVARPLDGQATATVEGRELRLFRPDKRPLLTVTVPEDSPFAFIQSIQLEQQAGTNLKTDRFLEGKLDLGLPAEKLSTLGTAGLTRVDGHPGSHVFLAVADPATRRGMVAGFTTFKKADGILFSGRNGGAVTFAAQNDYGRYLLPAGKAVAGDTLAIGFFPDARLGLEQWADATAKANNIKIKPRMAGYCTWYSQPHGGACDEKNIRTIADFSAKELAPFGFNYIQIDDYWQDGKRRTGPAKVFERVNPNGPYPSGMKAAADYIRSKGFTAGLWYMPFSGDHEDPWFQDKLHWFAKKPDGSPYFTPAFGGGSLDLTNPEVVDYIHRIAKLTTQEWGYRLLKLDGLWTGFANAQTYVANGYKPDDLGEATVLNPQLTPYEAYQQAFRKIREGAGEDTYILGCCAPQNMRSFSGAIGNVDAMRIGPDNSQNWAAICSGPWHGTNRYFFNGRIWHNDPDPVYVRSSVPIEHARSIVSWVTITGSLNASSEWFPDLPADRVDLLRRSLPSHNFPARPLDLFETGHAQAWHVQNPAQPHRHLISLFEWSGKNPSKISRTTDKLDLPPGETWVGYEYWSDSLVAPFKDSLETTLAPATCKIISLVALRQHPQILGTSRHITQGLMDLHDEAWSAEKSSLSASSDLVANDPYQVRILASGDLNKAATVTLDEASTKAGVTAEIQQRGPLVRLNLKSPDSRRVSWSLKFDKSSDAGIAGAAVKNLRVVASAYGRVEIAWDKSEHLWIVQRDSEAPVIVDQPVFVDASPEPGREHEYKVSVWSVEKSGPTASVKTSTPSEPTLPPLPPAPEIHLSDLTPQDANAGSGQIQKDKASAGTPLTIGGEVFQRGIGTHAVSTITYPLKPEYRRFVAVAGLDDSQRHQKSGSVEFIVRIVREDRTTTEAARSPKLLWNKAGRWHFDIPIPTGARAIQLVVEDAGDGIRCDLADWANAGFLSQMALAQPTPTPQPTAEAPKGVTALAKPDTKWFQDDRFGMFIHFGLYSIPAGEWKGVKMGRNSYAEWIRMQQGFPNYNSEGGVGLPRKEYDELLEQFNPQGFNADEWMRLAKEAGVKYIVVTSKHHDGFALWPSKASSYNVMATPFKRDIIGELAAACKKYDINLGLYYSHWLDWGNPGGGMPPFHKPDPEPKQPTQEEYEQYWQQTVIPQVTELIEAYHPKLFWFDNFGRSPYLTEKRLDQLITLVREKSPGTLINSRIGTQHGNHSKGNAIVDYISSDDNHFPTSPLEGAWETSATMQGSWGYHKLDGNWKPVGQLIRHLVDNTSLGGNIQLNIGPMGDGRIPAPSVRRLKEIGSWMAVNGESIYGAGPVPLPAPAWGRFTGKKTPEGYRLYAHLYRMPDGRRIVLPGVTQKPRKAQYLETGFAAESEIVDGNLNLILPPANLPDDRVSVLAVDFEKPL